MRLLWAFEIAMEVGGSRSHSVPVGDRSGPGGLDVNPFYSEKAKDQCRLDAARPKELPAQEEEVLAGSFSSPELATYNTSVPTKSRAEYSHTQIYIHTYIYIISYAHVFTRAHTYIYETCMYIIKYR